MAGSCVPDTSVSRTSQEKACQTSRNWWTHTASIGNGINCHNCLSQTTHLTPLPMRLLTAYSAVWTRHCATGTTSIYMRDMHVVLREARASNASIPAHCLTCRWRVASFWREEQSRRSPFSMFQHLYQAKDHLGEVRHPEQDTSCLR
jgi:hypothetical protein